MNTFVSPDTGKIYEIEPQSRWFNDFSNDGKIVKKYYTQYNILDNGKKVQFALDEKGIANSVKDYEFPGWDGITSSPRD